MQHSAKGGRAVSAGQMLKNKGRAALCLFIGLICLFMLGGVALAATDTLQATIEVNPAQLTKAGPVSVKITMTNISDQEITSAITLYDPNASEITGVFAEGETLPAGQSKTWEGEYVVTDKDLTNGSFNYYIKYKPATGSESSPAKTMTLRAAIAKQVLETNLEVKRTVSPTVAKEGQQIAVRYDLTNAGTLVLKDIVLQESKDIYSSKKKITIPSLDPGATATLNFPAVTMGTKDLTSKATITYITEKSKKKQTYNVEELTIRYGNPALSAKLTSEVKGVMQGNTVKLTLKLTNSGTLDFSDITVTDEKLGTLFTGQAVQAKNTLELVSEQTITEDTTFKWIVTGVDATGAELSITTDEVTVAAMDPSEVLHLNVTVTADRTEVFEQPANVRFTITVENDSQVDAQNVKLSHGNTDIYTFTTIPAGESRTISRDTALSTAGKFRFTVTAKDKLDNESSFDSNDIQVAFSMPTAVPATPTPAPVPTAEPTFQPVTVPPLSSASVAPTYKMARNIAYTAMIVLGALTAVGVLLLLLSLIRRGQRNSHSKNALDNLNVASRTDYFTKAASNSARVITSAERESEEEKPHMKYIRTAHQEEDLTGTGDMPENAEEIDFSQGASADEDAYKPKETPETGIAPEEGSQHARRRSRSED